MNKNRVNPETWYVIINPVGGNGSVQKRWPVIRSMLQDRGVLLEEVFTRHKMHAVELVETALVHGFRRMLAVGGDGTNNEVINGIMLQQVVPTNEILYALLPIGTGNDWIRTHGISRNPETWVNMLLEGYSDLQDIGQVHYQADGQTAIRYFANVAGMAYDAFVVAEMAKKQRWVIGRFIYLLFIMVCLFRYTLKPARVLVNGQILEDRFYTINVGICRYSGGGMQFVPHANPTDGQLAFTTAGALSIPAVIRATPYFYNGRVAEYKKVHTGFAKQIRVEHVDSETPVQLEVDGEYLGTTPVEFNIIPLALRFVCPAQVTKPK